MITPIQSLSNYRDMTPFVLAAVALLVLNRRRVISVGAGRRSSRWAPRSWPATADATTPPPPASPRGVERGALVRPAVIAALLLFVLLALPSMLSLYYVDAMTQVAIYSIVALGLGLLVGRVGMVSLGQAAVLAIGAWVAARLLFATSLPYPLVLLAAGLITMVLGTLVGCRRCG